jgi:hypothetical protein
MPHDGIQELIIEDTLVRGMLVNHVQGDLGLTPTGRCARFARWLETSRPPRRLTAIDRLVRPRQRLGLAGEHAAKGVKQGRAPSSSRKRTSRFAGHIDIHHLWSDFDEQQQHPGPAQGRLCRPIQAGTAHGARFTKRRYERRPAVLSPKTPRPGRSTLTVEVLQLGYHVLSIQRQQAVAETACGELEQWPPISSAATRHIPERRRQGGKHPMMCDSSTAVSAEISDGAGC